MARGTFSRAESDDRHILSKPDKYGRRPLDVACQNGNLKVVEFLIGKGCLLKTEPDKSYPDIPLLVAARWNHLSIVEYLLKCSEYKPKVIKIGMKTTTSKEIKNSFEKYLESQGIWVGGYFCCFCRKSSSIQLSSNNSGSGMSPRNIKIQPIDSRSIGAKKDGYNELNKMGGDNEPDQLNRRCSMSKFGQHQQAKQDMADFRKIADGSQGTNKNIYIVGEDKKENCSNDNSRALIRRSSDFNSLKAKSEECDMKEEKNVDGMANVNELQN